MINHSFATRVSEKNFVDNKIVPTQIKFAVFSPDPNLWNDLLNTQQRAIESEISYKNTMKIFFLLIGKRNKVFLVKLCSAGK